MNHREAVLNTDACPDLLLAASASAGYFPTMSTATLQQFGQSLPSWLAPVQRGETVAIMDGGHEVARLVPPEKPKAVAPAPAWSWKDHLAELEAIFPEPVTGVAEELEASREDRF